MWLNSNSFCNHDSLRDFFFSGQIDTFFSCLVMYPLRTNDSDELTYFLCFPEAPARWGISCVPLHLRVRSSRRDRAWAKGRNPPSALFSFPAIFARNRDLQSVRELAWRNLPADMITERGSCA